MEINEIEIHNKEKKIKEMGLYEISKSICQISFNQNYGIGFLIHLYRGTKKFFCLMTNADIVTKEMIESNNTIEVKYKYDKKSISIKLDESKRFIKCYKFIDVTIIEIISSDEVKEKYFLLPSTNFYINYINKDIYIPQIILGQSLSYSKGKIEHLDNIKLKYKANIPSGFSGSPIFLKNSIEVIGIHKQENNSYNYGILIYPIIQLLQYDKTDIYYIGRWAKGKKEGEGKEYYENGEIKYDGNFVNDKYEGMGKYIYENGDYYIGQWLNGKKHGKGYIRNSEEKNLIEVFYNNDKRQEKEGKSFNKDGNVYNRNNQGKIKGVEYRQKGIVKYEGEMIDGVYNGNGKYIYENGEIYIGQWSNGKRHGKGILYYDNGKIAYEGDFVNDFYDGYGTYYYEKGGYYEGEWKKGKKDGKGIIFYENGKIKYKGDFVNNFYEGYGIYNDPEGRHYEGYWANNKRNGKGKEFDVNNKLKYDGYFEDGKFIENS